MEVSQEFQQLIQDFKEGKISERKLLSTSMWKKSDLEKLPGDSVAEKLYLYINNIQEKPQGKKFVSLKHGYMDIKEKPRKQSQTKVQRNYTFTLSEEFFLESVNNCDLLQYIVLDIGAATTTIKIIIFYIPSEKLIYASKLSFAPNIDKLTNFLEKEFNCKVQSQTLELDVITKIYQFLTSSMLEYCKFIHNKIHTLE